MRSLITGALILLSSVSLGAQHPKDTHIVKNLPGLYITFEKIGQLQSPDIVDDKERIWLRLHNNSRWPIRLDMGGVPAEYGDARLFFDGLANGEVIFRDRCHACSTNLMSPGKSILFNVSRRDLGVGRAIRVKFSYGWEQWDDVTAGREPEHYVYFYASQLPQQFQQAASFQGGSDPKVQIDYICEGARESIFSKLKPGRRSRN